MFYLYRRRKLGNGTCRAIQQYLKTNHNVDSIILRNDQPAPVFTKDDVLLRWGCTTQVLGKHQTLNKANAINLTSNKSYFRNLLQAKYPDIVPKTWFHIKESDISYPCIIRKRKHAQGKDLWLCNSLAKLQQIFYTKINQYLDDDYYISKYIPKVKEYRVCFIQNRVAWVAQKIPANPGDIAWNVAQGSKFINVRWKNWPLHVLETALIAHKESGLYISGVDIMVDMEDKPYILEVNSAPSHTSPYRQLSTAKCIGWGIKNNIFTTLPLNTDYTKYMKYAHPGLTS